MAKETETDRRRRLPVPAVRGDIPDVHRWWIPVAGLATILVIVGLTSTLAWGLKQPLPFSKPSDSILPSNARDAAVWTSATLLILVPASALLPWVESMLRGRWGGLWGRFEALAVRRHERRRADLIARAAKGGSSSSAVTGLALHLLYPSSGVLRPTALGNVLAAVDDRVAARHDGLPLVAAWPRLRRFLTDAERTALDARERRTRALLTIAAAALIALGFTYIIAIGSAFVDYSWPLLIGVLAAAIAAYGAYQAAVNAAVLEGIAVEAAVDVHLEAFLEAIGMSAAAGAKSRRQAFATLFDPVTSVEDTLQRLGIAGSRDVVTDRLMSDIRRSVQEEMASALPGAVAGPVKAAVQASFREFVEGEPLVNYDGVVSVGLRNGHGETVPIGDDRSVDLDSDLSYQLDVTIGPGPVQDAATVPLSIGTGVDEEIVPFEVAIDSDVRELRQAAVPLPVRPGDTGDVTFPLNVGSSPPSWIWIRVVQRGRTVQNLELSATSHQAED